MIKKFLEKAAAQACLVNIGCDMKRLAQALPRNPVGASKATFSILQNIIFAFSNGAEENQIARTVTENAIKEKLSKGNPAYELAIALFNLARAQHNKNLDEVNIWDETINRIFRETTGEELDLTQTRWRDKISIGSQTSEPVPPIQSEQVQSEREENIKAGRVFTDKVIERLRSGEILNDLDQLKIKDNTKFRSLLINEVLRVKGAFDLLASYGSLDEDHRRILNLCNYIIKNEEV